MKRITQRELKRRKAEERAAFRELPPPYSDVSVDDFAFYIAIYEEILKAKGSKALTSEPILGE